MESQVAIADADETEGDGRRLREGMGDGQRDRATGLWGGVDGGCAAPRGGSPQSRGAGRASDITHPPHGLRTEPRMADQPRE